MLSTMKIGTRLALTLALVLFILAELPSHHGDQNFRHF